MKTEIGESIYHKCFTDISEIYENARSALVKAYWHIGKHIVQVEQKRSVKAKYGKYVIKRLSEDLTKKYGEGSGFSYANLCHMRNFYVTYSILQPARELEWSKYVELLYLKDEKKRKYLEKRAIEEKLTRNQLRRIVKDYNRNMIESRERINRLEYTRGLLFTYSLVDREKIPYPEGKVIVDCGFNVWRSVAVENSKEFDEDGIVRSVKRKTYSLEKAGNDRDMLYSYRCIIEKVIDGDTLWAIIDLGFETNIRQKLRLRGIDAPEPHTEEGKRAKGYVERKLKKCPNVVIKTYKSDKYDRYLTDIFYLPGETDSYRLAREGVFLNQELLDKGLVQVF
jgi:endonuclease YncB( thermonuclease family)